MKSKTFKLDSVKTIVKDDKLSQMCRDPKYDKYQNWEDVMKAWHSNELLAGEVVDLLELFNLR